MKNTTKGECKITVHVATCSVSATTRVRKLYFYSKLDGSTEAQSRPGKTLSPFTLEGAGIKKGHMEECIWVKGGYMASTTSYRNVMMH